MIKVMFTSVSEITSLVQEMSIVDSSVIAITDTETNTSIIYYTKSKVVDIYMAKRHNINNNLKS